MTIETNSNSSSVSSPRERTVFQVGKTRRQRQAQYRQQMNVLLMTLLVTVVVGGLVIWLNWRGAGSTRTVSCDEFPQFCVPLIGGAANDRLEAASSRILDEESQGAEGVVRGISSNNVAFIGDPDALIHFRTISDFACGACQNYHSTDLPRFLEDYVMTGQATFGFAMTTGTGGAFSEIASQAALCAGEQGAFWEMGEEMFRVARSRSVNADRLLQQLKRSADDMGLNGKDILSCVSSNRYASFLIEYGIFANDHGVTGTPTVLVSYGDSDEWTPVLRSYDSLKQLTEAANATAR